MTEHGFYHPDFGYWQTTTYPSDRLLADHPVGTIEVPVRPSPDYVWENDEWVYQAPIPPTDEELRERKPPLTARQLRLGLLNTGTTEAQVEAHIASIEDDFDRQAADIEWRSATTFDRLHPLVVSLGAALGYSPEWIDSLFDYYVTI